MPKSSSSNVEIQALVSDFTSSLAQLVRRSALEQVVAALGGSSSPQAKQRGRPAGSTSKKKGAVDADQLLAHVKKNPGQLGTQIASALRTNVDTMRPTMKSLIASKKVKTHGQRRGMTYSAV